MYNIFNPGNTAFKDFQSNSDSLVLDMIIAKQENVDTGKRGLGFYMDSAGWLIRDPIALRENQRDLYLSNDQFDNGYAKTGDKIVVWYNAGTANIFVEGNWIRFEDGTKVQINDVESDVGEGASWTITASLDIEKGVNETAKGNLLNAVVLDESGNEYPRGFMDMYVSQYGLQGRLVSKAAFIGHTK